MSKCRTYHPRGVLVDGFSVQDHPSYQAWAGMLARCTNQNEPGYSGYGGRGIAVCSEWEHFANFAADMGVKPEGLTLERIDVDAGYNPSNCIWADHSVQALNRRVFKSNTSGHTGVLKVGSVWLARMDWEGVRYNIGGYQSNEEAVSARAAFEELFFVDRDAALKMIKWKTGARSNSSTGVRGVSPHPDGGFTVRISRNGVRHYLGYFQSFEDACDARRDFLEG